ncbi:MAG: VWA domain-containing protein [Actinomycetota bacterium]
MKVKAHLDVDLVALEAQDSITLMLDLTAPIDEATKDRLGQAVQIVLDRSGSMNGEPLESAKGSLLALVDRLAPQDSFGLVAFDDQALVIVPIALMSDHNLPSLRKAIRDIPSGGSTDISAGYLLGLREVSHVKAPGGATLLLISDGHANAGEQQPSFFADVAIKAAQSSVTTATIGLGVGYDETILEAAAQGGGGAHRFANTIDEAVGAIAAEVDDLLDKSVLNAVLRVRPLVGTQGVPEFKILQRFHTWRDGADYVVQLGDLYAGENRRVVINIDVPQIAALGLCTIAELTLEYLNLAERQEISVTLPVTVNVVPVDIAAGRVPNPIVRAERLILEAQSEKALATDEIKSGKAPEATNRLKSASAKLRREASLLPATDERTAESLASILNEAVIIDNLAEFSEFERPEFSSKRMTESYSNTSRSKKFRNQPSEDPTHSEGEAI